MRTAKQLLIGSLLALVAAAATAHGNHGDDKPMGRNDAIERGERVVVLLVADKKLAESWQKKKLKEVSRRQTPAGRLWVVSYENPSESDSAKQTIYIFLDEFGNFVGSNYSGDLGPGGQPPSVPGK